MKQSFSSFSAGCMRTFAAEYSRHGLRYSTERGGHIAPKILRNPIIPPRCSGKYLELQATQMAGSETSATIARAGRLIDYGLFDPDRIVRKIIPSQTTQRPKVSGLILELSVLSPGFGFSRSYLSPYTHDDCRIRRSTV